MGGLPVGYLKGRGKRGMNKTDKTRRKNTVLLNNSELTGSALFFSFFVSLVAGSIAPPLCDVSSSRLPQPCLSWE